MSKPSPDLERQKELKNQIQHQEQELTTLQQSTKIAKQQWHQEKADIEADKAVVIATTKQAIVTATKAEKEALAAIKADTKKTKEAHDLLLKDTTAIIATLQSEIAELENQKKIKNQAYTDLINDIRDSKAEKIVLTTNVEQLKVDKGQLTDEVIDLNMEISTKKEELSGIESAITVKEELLTKLKADHTNTVANQDRELAILEAKKQAIIQEAEASKLAQDQVRDNLAVWSKKLEEQDKNLRIREEKVNQQEKSIARNYNLLSL